MLQHPAEIEALRIFYGVDTQRGGDRWKNNLLDFRGMVVKILDHQGTREFKNLRGMCR